MAQDANGYTIWTESGDTRKVYVSQSDGDDADSGLTEALAKKTIAAGVALMRDGFPDWLLLKRGDTWTNEPIDTSWTLSGRSKSEPMLINSYGASEVRPVLKLGILTAWSCDPVGCSYVAIVGINFYAHTRNPSDGDYVDQVTGEAGFVWRDSTGGTVHTYFHVEDCIFNFFKSCGAVIDTGDESANDFVFRRNQFTNSYRRSSEGNSHGLYLQEVHDILMEENLFDHNGWNETATEAEATTHNHNVYYNVGCSNLNFSNNINARPSSHGIQMREGGTFEDNLVIQAPLNSFGFVLGGSQADPYRDDGVSGTIKNNCIMDPGDIDGASRGTGFEIANINATGLEISGNLFANDASPSPNSRALDFVHDNGPVGLSNVNIHDNVVYSWKLGLYIRDIDVPAFTLTNFVHNDNEYQAMLRNESNGVAGVRQTETQAQITHTNNTYDFDGTVPADREFRIDGVSDDFASWQSGTEATATESTISYTDATRTAETYRDAEESTSGSTLDDFLDEVKLQSPYNWRTAYTAKEVNDWIKGGFDMVVAAPVSASRGKPRGHLLLN